MGVIRGLSELGLGLTAPAVTIGNFDGVHRGHQQVMLSAGREATRRGVRSVVCTFDPHTLHVLVPSAAPLLLQTVDQRVRAIADLGVDVVVVIPFDREVAAIGRRRFVDEFLVGELDVGSLHVSKGFSFGRQRAGRTAYLEERGADSGFSVERVAPAVVAARPVSSSWIRDLVRAGKMARAAELIGRPYAIAGSVVPGSGRGATLGIPTANVAVENGCLPAIGVYVARAMVDGEVAPAVMNVGHRPTFDGTGGPVQIEAHLLDEVRDLYGQSIELAMLDRLRDERRFDSVDELRRQIETDVEQTRHYFASRENAVS